MCLCQPPCEGEGEPDELARWAMAQVDADEATADEGWPPERVRQELAVKRYLLNWLDHVEDLYAVIQPYAEREGFRPEWLREVP